MRKNKTKRRNKATCCQYRLRDANELARTAVLPEVATVTGNAWGGTVKRCQLNDAIRSAKKLLFLLEDAKAALDGK